MTQATSGTRLPPAYAERYAELLHAVGTTAGVRPPSVAAFWPMVGHAYSGDLLVVGRAVNRWMDEFEVGRLGTADAAREATERTRRRSEESGGCPLRWVTDSWGRPADRYSSARSSFWQVARLALAAADPASITDPDWPSRLAWSNLAKVAPWKGRNPGGRLLGIQRELGPALLAAEVAALRPRLVLVMTGTWWFEPTAAHLRLELRPGPDSIEATAESDGCRWIVVPHPQGKSRDLRTSITEEIGRPSSSS